MRLVQVVNNVLPGATGGGGSRILALDQFVQRTGGAVIVVQNKSWQRSRLSRQMRLFGVLREVRRAGAATVIVRYPGFPFFWSIHRDREMKRSYTFLRLLAGLKRRIGSNLVVDVIDLLRFPSPNPELSLKLDDRLLGQFEQTLFDTADEIWSCSKSIGEHLAEVYKLPPGRIRVVYNGDFRPANEEEEPSVRLDPDCFSFFYAGDLAPGWRGAEIMLDAFTRSVSSASARLVVCGTNGEWIAGTYADSRIVNLGVIPAQEVRGVGRQCDVGLIPQPEEGYYHLVFPTKLGLYMTLGLPVITTRAREADAFVTGAGIGASAAACDWGEVLEDAVQGRLPLEQWSAAARARAEEFYWDRLYGAAWDAFAARKQRGAT